MAQHLLDLLRTYLGHYGYWTLMVALLLENAGAPVPGETILLLASAMAASQHQLQLRYIVLTATCAATLGDNLGFVIGTYGGRPMLERYGRLFHITDKTVSRAEGLLQKHGALTIFVGRFIAGVRIIAGPLAGILRMPWKKFAIANLAGAAVWVTSVSTVGYLFGKNWDLLLTYVKRANIFLVFLVALVLLFFWWRSRRPSSIPQI